MFMKSMEKVTVSIDPTSQMICLEQSNGVDEEFNSKICFTPDQVDLIFQWINEARDSLLNK